MLTVMIVLLAISIVLLIVHVVKPPFPLWPAVLVLQVMFLVQALPIGK